MSNNHFATVFPGQGSQSVAMLAALAQKFSLVSDLYEQASGILGYDLWHLVQQGPAEKLNQTESTQPALLVADIAVYQCWCQSRGVEPALMAGHSLGEFSALVCAESLSFTDAVALVAKRGQYMQQADAGAMAAIIGLDEQQIGHLCAQAAEGQLVSPANYNSIGQTVIAGEVAAIVRAVELAKKQGAKIAKRIPVSVASHCQLMQSAATQLAQDLQKITLQTPKIPVIQNFDVTMHHDAQSIRHALVEQLTNPVRWVETIQLMVSLGVSHILECGPGKVLQGLIKRIDKKIIVLTSADPDKMATALEAIKG